MDIIRRGNDINVTWEVFGRNGYKYSLAGKVGKLWLVSGPRKKEITAYTVQARNELVFVVDNNDLNRYGAFKLVLQIREPGSEVEEETYDLTHAFQVVSESYPMTANKAVDGQVDMRIRSILKNVYVSTLEGESAYEAAVRNGFDGTESEWLLSLIGVRDIEQTASSEESGGLNQVTAILADGSTRTFSWRNGEQGNQGSSTLNGLSDVTISSPVRNQVLTYNGSRWVNGSGSSYSYGSGVKISSGNVISADIPQIAAGLIAAGYSLDGGGSGGGGGATSLAGLSDVDGQVIPVDKQVLGYDASTSKWRPMTVESGGSGGSGGGGGGGEIDPSVLADYVTIAEDETITGQKKFSKPIILTDSIMIGQSNPSVFPDGTEESKMRIYFGDKTKYIEYDAVNQGFLFYGGGIYTNSYVSAGGLGTGGGGTGGSSTLAGLDDVDFETDPPQDGQFLSYSYDETTAIGKWVPVSAAGITGDYLPLDGTGIMTGPIVTETSNNTNINGVQFIRYVNDEPELIGGLGMAHSDQAGHVLSLYARGNNNYSSKITLRPTNNSNYGLEVTTADVKFNGASLRKVFWGFMNSTHNPDSSPFSKYVACSGFTAANLVNGTVVNVYATVSADYDASSTITIDVAGTGEKTLYTCGKRKKWNNPDFFSLVYYKDGNNHESWFMNPSYGYLDTIGGGGGSSSSYSPGEGISITGTTTKTIKITKATNNSLGGLSLKYAATTASGTGVNKDPTVNDRPNSRSGKLYWVEMNSAGNLFVEVPWVSGSSGSAGVTSVVSKTGDVTAADISSAIGLSSYLTSAQAAQTYLPLSAGSGKALQNTLYSKGIVPTGNNSYNLGSSSAYWNNGYIKRLYFASNVYVEYDSQKGFYFHGAGITSDSFVSAGGLS